MKVIYWISCCAAQDIWGSSNSCSCRTLAVFLTPSTIFHQYLGLGERLVAFNRHISTSPNVLYIQEYSVLWPRRVGYSVLWTMECGV